MKRISTATSVTNKFGAGKNGFTDGDVMGGVPATDLEAALFDNLQEEIANVVESAGIVLDGNVRTQLLQALRKHTDGVARVKGLLASNNVATPNTQYDFLAAAVTLRDPATGAMYSVQSPASKTNNIATAGPAANGRDQAGAFGTGVWVHFYYIFNPTTAVIDTISSLSASAPAALPAGYTAWAYIGAVRLDGSGVILSSYMRGSWVQYTTYQVTLTNGGAVAATGVSTAVYCPPNALAIRLVVTNLSIVSAANGSYSISCTIGATGAFFSWNGILNGTGGASANMASGGNIIILPNVSQNYTYSLSNLTGTSGLTTHALSGYQVPNGGE